VRAISAANVQSIPGDHETGTIVVVAGGILVSAMIEPTETCAMAGDRSALFAAAARGKISAQADHHKSRRKCEKASRRPQHTEHIRPHDGSVGTDTHKPKDDCRPVPSSSWTMFPLY